MNVFETESEVIDGDRSYESNNDNVIEWIKNGSTATISFSQGKFIGKIKKLAEKFPQSVQIVHENDDGSIVAHIPVSYIHISNSTRTMTEEQRRKIAERLNVSRRKKDGD